MNRLHDTMAAHVQRGDSAGLVTLVRVGGRDQIDAIGRLAIDQPAPMRADTLFRISSMTKPITAVAALIMVEEGKLRLDVPVDEWLPELAHRRVLRRLDAPIDDTVPAARPIQVRDLLTFCMGFGQLMAPPDAYPILKAAHALKIGMGPPAPSEMPAPDEWLARLGSLPLMHQPGERWMYNTGSDVLGVLIARASGRSFPDFLHERLFEPLGMKDTGFSVSPEKIARLAPSYWTNFATGALEVYDPAAGGQWSRPPLFPSGAGGLVSTAQDYAAFAQMLLDRGVRGNARILSAASVAAMTTDQLTSSQKLGAGLVPGYFDHHGWGFGVSVVTSGDDPAEPIGSYGWDGGLGTSFRNDPKDQRTILLMTQRAWTSPSAPQICRDFWALAR